MRLSSLKAAGGGFTKPLGGSAVGFYLWHFRSPLKARTRPGGYLDSARGNANHQGAVCVAEAIQIQP